MEALLMKSITIRGIDDITLELLKQKANSERKSMNQLLLETIKKSLGLADEKKFTAEYHDLDHLFGQWSEDEFAAIQGKISRERQIDQDLWQ
jgi:Trm5-related predicted tRNA methylase